MKIEMSCFIRSGLRHILLIFFVLSVPLLLLAQTRKEVKGTINDKKNNPLAGVSVLVKGTSNGVTTDDQGRFAIDVKNADVLVISYLSHAVQEIPVGDKTTINIQLDENVASLDQVVVVGYGQQRKATVTGAVVTVSGKELQKSPVVNLSNALAGQLPGLITMNRQGQPGKDDAQILIRGMNTTGNNSPLVLVDNVEYPDWQRLNSNDIESISVLKDASAAIYGARAANGVILITTKRGTTGKPLVTYSFNQGLSQPTRTPKMASSAQWGEYYNDYLAQRNLPPRFTEDELRKFADGSDPVNYPNVDWYREVLKKTTPQSQHNLNVRGGTENIKYSVSGSYGHQTGIFKGGSMDYKVFTLRSNIDLKVNQYIRVGAEVNAIKDNLNSPAYDGPFLYQLIPAFPYLPVFWPNGLPSTGFVGANPRVLATDQTGNQNAQMLRLQARGNFDISIPWVEGLGIDGFAVYNEGNNFNKNWTKPYFVYNYDAATNTYTPVAGFSSPAAPTLTQVAGRNRSTLMHVKLKYARRFGNHNLNTFVAGEQQEGFSNSFSAGRINFPTPAIDELFAGSPVNMTNSGSSNETARQNLFGRLSYDFKERYSLDFNFRYDGSPNFPPDKRFGFFKGLGLAWRISEEAFVSKNLPFINELKLRGSYGEVGNDQVPGFQYLSLYNFSGGYHFGQTLTPSQGLVAGVSPNPNISWEIAKLKNIALEGSLWNGLFGFVIERFHQKRSNILASRGLAVPGFAAISLPNENFGVVENKGYEVQVSTTKTIRDFSFRVAANAAYARNKVIDVAESPNVPEWQRQTGHILGALRVYKAKGIFYTQAELDAAPKPVGALVGDLRYEDINKDGLINASDMMVVDKSNVPQVTFGSQVSLGYKNFSLWANFAGQSNAWTFFTITGRVNSNSLEDVIVNRWRPGTTSSKYPRLLTTGQMTSDYWLKDATFIRLKTLELAYSFPEKWLRKINVSSFRVYANGNNLFTIDKLKWFDPEGISTFGDFYPQSKIYNFGFSLSF
jgi:TonB-dependent starch-binding outer membrane protein SusC